jgi:hypothetical protein
MPLIQVGSIPNQETLFLPSPMFLIAFLSFVMIMEASSELLHHESSAKGASPSAWLYDLFVAFPRSTKRERKRVHNSKLFSMACFLAP